MFWYDQIWSLEEDRQADARIHWQGQTRSILVMRLMAGGTVDEDTVAALERKAEGQESLMAAVKARTEEVSLLKKGILIILALILLIGSSLLDPLMDPIQVGSTIPVVNV